MTEEGRRLYERDGGLEIGPALEKARRQQGLTLDEVEQATKIRKRYLQGLENDDYGVLPDAVYVQGFVKTYANYLGLDGEQLADELRSRRKPRRERHAGPTRVGNAGFDKPLISPGGLAGAERRRISGRAVLGLLTSVLVIVVVIGALYYVGRETRVPDANSSDPASRSEQADRKPDGSGDEKPTADTASAEGSPEVAKSLEEADAGASAKKAAATAPAPEGVQVDVSVEGSPSWISIASDGTVVFEQVAAPGFQETFEAEEMVSISTGNAGAVSLTVNGEDVGTMGDAGAVVSREFTRESSG